MMFGGLVSPTSRSNEDWVGAGIELFLFIRFSLDWTGTGFPRIAAAPAELPKKARLDMPFDFSFSDDLLIIFPKKNL